MIQKFNDWKNKEPFENLVERVGKLGEFLVYGLGMRAVVDEYFAPYYTKIDFNTREEYQLPLSLLYKTGKYPDIKFQGGKYSSPAMIKRIIVGNDGKWHPSSKLNTNAFDQAQLLCDLLKITESLQGAISTKSETELKSFLKDFFTNYDLVRLIKENGVKLSRYTNFIKKFSKVGEEAEREVEKFLESQGYVIEYRGGDGDPVDMGYGIDLIVSKDDKIETVQVKTRKEAALKAKSDARYKNIDLFYYTKGGIGKV